MHQRRWHSMVRSNSVPRWHFNPLALQATQNEQALLIGAFFDVGSLKSCRCLRTNWAHNSLEQPDLRGTDTFVYPA